MPHTKRIALTTFIAASALLLSPLVANAEVGDRSSGLISSHESRDVSAAPTPDSNETDVPQSVPGEYIVTYDSNTSATKVKKAISDAAATTDRDVDESRSVAPQVVLATLDGALDHQGQKTFEQSLNADPRIASVEPNYLLSTQNYPLSNDTDVAKLWNIQSASGNNYGVNANVAWQTGVTGKGSTIAILDTGIIAHPDLTQNTIAGYDFVSATSSTSQNPGYGLSNDGDGWDPDPTDPGDYCNVPGTDPEDAVSSWHGSHVAGIAAATSNNNLAVAGVAPEANIEPVRVLGSCGSGTAADIIAGITWASGGTVANVPKNRNPATVLNMSVGVDTMYCGKSAMQTAISAAISRGTTVVVAAGNETESLAKSLPANCDGVVDVTASTSAGDLAWYSNYGQNSHNLVIGAPGGGGKQFGSANDLIYSTVNSSRGALSTADDAYKVEGMGGTSMAAPHVAGLVALIKQKHPAYSPIEVASALKASVRSWSSSSNCTASKCGAGIASAANFALNPSRLLFVLTTAPTINGAVKVGKTVTANTSAWTPSANFTYRWLVNGKVIATGSSMNITGKFAGKKLVVEVDGKRTGFDAVASKSVAKTVAKGTFKTKTVRLAGKRKIGHKLVAHTGSWGPSASYHYRWYANGKKIANQTSAKLKLSKKLKGKRIKVTVTALGLGYKTAQRSSGSTAKIRK